MSSTDRAQAAARVAEFVKADPVWTGARIVMLYCAFGDELDTDPLFRAARAAGKSVLYPRCLPGDDNRMEVCLVEEPGRLCPGRFGVNEPDASHTGLVDPSPDLVLVPGLAFDRRGGRLGFGGGFYDRFLARLAHPHKRLGLCYSIQLVPNVPVDPWDVQLDGVVSEKEVLWF